MKIREALFKISPDCNYDLWWRLARAIYSELGDDGFDLFDEWSSKSKLKYPGQHQCRYQWEHAKNYSQINIGTLFYHANKSDD